MKMIAIAAQVLIGVTLLWLGVCSFLHRVANLPLECIAHQSIGSIFFSRYLAGLCGLQLLGSLLLLFGRWKLLTLALLDPIALNLVVFHFLLGSRSGVVAVLLTLVEFFAIWICCRYFRPAFLSESAWFAVGVFETGTSCDRKAREDRTFNSKYRSNS
jgi:hypothetical protein